MSIFRRRRDPPPSPDPEVVEAVVASGLFDPDWYLHTYPEVTAFPPGPLAHFCQHGLAERRDPGPNFSTRKYLLSVPEAAGAPLPPFLHALRTREPTEDWRLWQPDDPGSLAALVAWSGLFDEGWYLRRNPDVARSGIPPLRHFAEDGARERRDPGPGFDSELYAETYAYDGAAYGSPIEHYLRVGRRLGHRPTGPSRYARWIDRHDALTPADLDRIRVDAAGLPPLTVVHVVDGASVPDRSTGDPAPENWLGPDATVQVLRGASISDEAWAARAIDQPNHHHADAASLVATLRPGAIVILCAEGAILRPHAGYAFARALTRSGARAAYADHDRIEADGTRGRPVFKPAMAPDFMRHLAYAGPVVALVRDEEAAGGLLEALTQAAGGAGSSAWAGLLLRFDPAQVLRLPFVLCHLPGPAPEPAFPTYEPIPDGSLTTVSIDPPPATARVRIIIPTRDRLSLLRACIESIEAGTDYPRHLYEIAVVDNGSGEDATLAYLEEIALRPGLRVIASPGPFNFARICNDGAFGASAEILVFLNNDMTVRRSDWLNRLVARVIRPEIGAVGARLLYPDGTVQHGGVVLGVDGVGAHRLVDLADDVAARIDVTREMSAVTGACLAIRREVFAELGGFDPLLAVAFNDVALCAAAIKAGYRNLYLAESLLDHHESQSRGSDEAPARAARNSRESAHVRSRYADLVRDDPSYSPNLSLTRIGHLADPPRVVRPWRRPPEGRRVLFLGARPGWNDPAATMLRHQAAHLAARGWEVIVGGPAGEREPPYPGCRRVPLAAAAEAAGFAIAEGVDCIVVHARPFVSIVNLLGPDPLVYLVDHGAPSEGADDPLAIDREMRLCAPLARRVFAATGTLRDRQFRRDAVLLRSGNDHGPAWSEAWAERRDAIRAAHGLEGRFAIVGHGGAGMRAFLEVAAEMPFARPELREGTVFVLTTCADPDLAAEARAAGLVVLEDPADLLATELHAASDLYLALARGPAEDPGLGRALAMGLDVIAVDSSENRARGLRTADGIPALCALIADRQAARERSPRRARIESWDEPLALFAETLEADCAGATRARRY